jgi:hypothetical protein
MWTRAWIGSVVLVTAAVLTGCSNTPTTSGTPPTLLATADLRLPLDGYQLSPADARRLARTHRVLVMQCLNTFGLDPILPAPSDAGPRTANERRYGLTDPAKAADGYWARERTSAGDPSTPDASLTTEVGDVVSGRGARTVRGQPVPEGGCAGQARRRMTAGHPEGADIRLGHNLASIEHSATLEDPAARAATQAWSACMSEAGFTYTDPYGPPDDKRFRGALSALEIATARADVACKEQTNLVGVWWSIESARQATAVHANRAALDLTARAIRAELTVADQIGAP